MKGRSCLPHDPEIIVRLCISPFWVCNEILSYGHLKSISALLVLHRQGGCSLRVLLFFLMLIGTCRFILSARLCLVCRYIPSFTFIKKFIIYATFLSGRSCLFPCFWWRFSISLHSYVKCISSATLHASFIYLLSCFCSWLPLCICLLLAIFSRISVVIHCCLAVSLTLPHTSLATLLTVSFTLSHTLLTGSWFKCV